MITWMTENLYSLKVRCCTPNHEDAQTHLMRSEEQNSDMQTCLSVFPRVSALVPSTDDMVVLGDKTAVTQHVPLYRCLPPGCHCSEETAGNEDFLSGCRR